MVKAQWGVEAVLRQRGAESTGHHVLPSPGFSATGHAPADRWDTAHSTVLGRMSLKGQPSHLCLLQSRKAFGDKQF